MEKIAPSNRAELGPYDISEVGVLVPYLDFGSIRIAPKQDLQIRADIEESTKRMIALTIEKAGHRIQLQAFASSKAAGIWGDTMAAIESGISAQGGNCERLDGLLGPELRAQVTIEEKGEKIFRESRFIGVDGPRWFLRGVLSGPELYLQSNYEALVEIFRATAVSRGNIAMPPGELLPLTLPSVDV
jgi:hypothetical protein